jgi:hypothetical protein
MRRLGVAAPTTALLGIFQNELRLTARAAARPIRRAFAPSLRIRMRRANAQGAALFARKLVISATKVLDRWRTLCDDRIGEYD